eukprot:scaffold2390_cov125-Isochrysis_galbana.AAC.3
MVPDRPQECAPRFRCGGHRALGVRPSARLPTLTRLRQPRAPRHLLGLCQHRVEHCQESVNRTREAGPVFESHRRLELLLLPPAELAGGRQQWQAR